jgi:antitoxin component of RelBE/YafQ-DinJ toxin-antitoxin module
MVIFWPTLNHQKIPFEWIVKNEITINQFKQNLSQNSNFQNKHLIEKIFLDKIIYVTVDQGLKAIFQIFYI